MLKFATLQLPMGDFESSYDSDRDELDGENGLAAVYTGLIATTRGTTINHIQILDIATQDCFGFLKKNYFDSKISLQQYTISTGEKAPRDLLTFCFDEDMHGKREKLGHNVVMQQFFRDVFIHEGSNPFQYGVYGTFVMYYLHEVQGCPGANMHSPMAMESFVRGLQVQASVDWWNSPAAFPGAVVISLGEDFEEDSCSD
jgi:hypothetical protein